MRSNLILNLVADRLLAPGRIGHTCTHRQVRCELLQVLAIASVQAPFDVRKVACVFHGQLTAPIPIGLLTRIACPRPETRTKAIPKVAQVSPQALDRLGRQSPFIWVEPIVIESRQRVIRL